MTGRARQRDRAPITNPGPGTTAGAPRRRRPIPFGVHQLSEYFFAVALVVLSVHIGRSELLLTAGALLGLLALTARGPLGIVRVCGSRLHAVLDVAAGILLAASPLVPALRPGVLGIVAVELVAVTWLRVTMLTRYAARADAPVAATVPPTATVPGPAAGGVRGAGSPSGPPLSAIRGLGRMTAGARNRLPEARATLDAGARRMGGHAGRLQRAWRRASK
ncbi:MAG TPA: hypothetical protein VN791_02830 [Acidimicrobiales bacterium]|nr:hypothetical protein [Acidimicrobiales bacterium]